jgi:hypothetical protein
MKTAIIIFILLLEFSVNSSAQIEGEVTDDQHKPLADVSISLTDTAGKKITTVRSDAKGFYTINKIAPGKYKIEAMLSGFVTFIKKNIEITTPPKTSDPRDDTYYAVAVDIVLQRAKNAKQ